MPENYQTVSRRVILRSSLAEVSTWQTQEWPPSICAYAYMPAKVHGVTLYDEG